MLIGSTQFGRAYADPDEVPAAIRYYEELARRGDVVFRVSPYGSDRERVPFSFDFSFNGSVNRKQIFDLATCAFVERAEGIWLIGPAGVGKSHLVQAIGHEAVRRGYDVLFVRASVMLASLYAGRADGSYDRRLLTYLRPDVLILDDFGLKPMRPPATEDIYDVIDGRYQRAPTLLTTNRDFTEWPELFDQPVLASAALDRMAHGATQITITGDSYRTKGPTPRSRSKPQKAADKPQKPSTAENEDSETRES